MVMRELPFELTTPGPQRARKLATASLQVASRALDALAQRLAPMPAHDSGDAVLEFHADAGAPEGALYINGHLVGHVLGITRL